MDPLVRQTSLEILLSHTGDLTESELREALHLGLTDPDIQINEVAWRFVREKGKTTEFKKELTALAVKVAREDSEYFQKLANEILGAVSSLRGA